MNKIIYLDAAASALKPDAVIAAESDFLRNKYANAGRGICARAAAVDDIVAHARIAAARFINAPGVENIVFTGGATDALNRVVDIVTAGRADAPRVMVSDLDHHSARLPWQVRAPGAVRLCICPTDGDFNLDADMVPDADVAVITAMSNVIGTPQDVARIVGAVRKKNPDIITIVDAAQYAAHAPIDVQKWDCDFLCFSAHKIGADTGLGVMYIKKPDRFAPDKFGGGMVSHVYSDGRIDVMNAPERFEAGTLPLTQIAGLSAAIDAWRPHAGLDIMRRIYNGMVQMPRVRVYTAPDASVLTFSVDGMHALDFGTLCGARGLCMRVGNMCASWAMNLIGAPLGGVARLSAGAWNTTDDADAALGIIGEVLK